MRIKRLVWDKMHRWKPCQMIALGELILLGILVCRYIGTQNYLQTSSKNEIKKIAITFDDDVIIGLSQDDCCR